MKLAYELEWRVSDKWLHAGQLGIEHAVCLSWPGEDYPFWDFMEFAKLKQRYADYGLNLAVIEAMLPLDEIREGGPNRDRDIDRICRVIVNMGALGIPVFCYNWMARIGWLRTSLRIPARGGSEACGFDESLIRNSPDPGDSLVSRDTLWETLEYFLKKVVPVAEKAGVKLAMHPDDPPLPSVAGVGRIMGSVAAFERLLSLSDSEANGITFCQGNFALMEGDLYGNIRKLVKTGRVYFAHFRNLRGDARKFEETFHDDGQIDMHRAMKAYLEAGFDGYMRCDHVPAMAGDDRGAYPGYAALGKLFAIGYMKGLIDGLPRTGCGAP
ncbi:MAG: mannonate dehydratase [Planctomycetota bacterium]|jgi:mannonate dehydratase|nr:mannonate dehydratase [Planctomycetota bacterium]